MASTCSVFAPLLLFLVCSVGSSASLSLSIEPRVGFISGSQELRVTCRADAPLAECQFRLHDEDVVMVPSVGVGVGLQEGECGLLLSKPQLAPGAYVLSCRVRGATGNWVYRDMTLYKVDGTAENRAVPAVMGWDYPHRVVVRKGEPFQVEYKLPAPNSEGCSFRVPGVKDAVRFPEGGENFQEATGGNAAVCGIRVLAAKKEYNGWMWGSTKTSSDMPFPKTTVIIAQYPTTIDMVVNSVPDPSEPSVGRYDEGDTLLATCTIGNSRPVANITWYLGQEMIRRDAVDDADAQNTWLWDYDNQTIVQNVTRELSWLDDGKELVCQVSFLDYDDLNDTTVFISIVHRKSGVVPIPVTVGELVFGEEVLVSVDTGEWEVSRPTFVWKIDEDTIREDQDYFYGYETSQEKRADGRWISSLAIYRLTWSHAETPLLLIAGNATLRREYLVTLVAVDLKLKYLFVTLASALFLMAVVLGIIYYNDIRRWFTESYRSNTGSVTFNQDSATVQQSS